MKDFIVEKLNREQRDKRRWVPEFVQPVAEELPLLPTSDAEEPTSGSCVVDFDVLG